jgi:hypothetical protein
VQSFNGHVGAEQYRRSETALLLEERGQQVLNIHLLVAVADG